MIYCDIDGTLTDNGDAVGPAIPSRVQAIKKLCESNDVVVWSGRGLRYAREFCEQHDIKAVAALGKPTKLYDDNPEIRPGGLSQYVHDPAALDGIE